jgi:hypothetical protein
LTPPPEPGRECVLSPNQAPLSPGTWGRDESQAEELLDHFRRVEPRLDPRNPAIPNLDTVKTAEAEPPAGRRHARWLVRARIRRGDRPGDHAPAAVLRDADRMSDRHAEVRECSHHGLDESTDCVTAHGWRMQHPQVVPVDVLSEEGRESIEVARIPCVQNGVNDTPRLRRATHWAPQGLMCNGSEPLSGERSAPQRRASNRQPHNTCITSVALNQPVPAECARPLQARVRVPDYASLVATAQKNPPKRLEPDTI